MASRNVSDLTPAMQIKFKKFSAEMLSKGISFILTCTARTVDEQVALYAQGRKRMDEVNRLRIAAGLPLLININQNKIVTWTLKSNHLVDLDDGNPNNDKSRAFDIAITKDGKPIWDIKVDVNQDQKPDYVQAGAIGESCGLRWGGWFKKPDCAHFEDIPNISVPDVPIPAGPIRR